MKTMTIEEVRNRVIENVTSLDEAEALCDLHNILFSEKVELQRDGSILFKTAEEAAQDGEG